MRRRRQAGTQPDALGLVLVHARSRRDRPAADESDVTLFQDFLKLAAFAEMSVKYGKDDIGGPLQARQVAWRNVAGEDVVARLFQTFNDRSPSDEADFTFCTRPAE